MLTALASVLFPGLGPIPGSVSALAGEISYYDPPARVGRISLARGAVSYRRRGDAGWSAATVNDPVTGGDDFWTGPGARSEIRVGSTALRLDGGTETEILRLDEANLAIGLFQGTLYLRVNQIPRGSAVSIEIPRATVRVLRAGSYHIGIAPGGFPVRVAVFEGEAEIVDPTAMLAIHEGDEAVLSGSDQIGYAVGEAEPTVFDDWSMDRDEMARAAPSARYLSTEMTGYEVLDDFGHWGPVPDYGPAWFPDAVPAGWAPYRYGHWSYVLPWGWTWIDDAPWGFAPTHYGRWVTIGGRWAWVPGTPVPYPVWAPALVVFIGGAAHRDVGWFPLAPREPYIPPYRCSETYVRVLNVVPSGWGAPDFRLYREGRGIFVNRSQVTVVSRDVVAEGKPVERAALARPSALPAQPPVPGQALPGLHPAMHRRGIPGPAGPEMSRPGEVPAPFPSTSRSPGNVPLDQHRVPAPVAPQQTMQPPVGTLAMPVPGQARNRLHDAGPAWPMPQPAPPPALPPAPSLRHAVPPPGWPAHGAEPAIRAAAPSGVPHPQPPAPPAPPRLPPQPPVSAASPARLPVPIPAPHPVPPQMAPPAVPHPQQAATPPPGQPKQRRTVDDRR